MPDQPSPLHPYLEQQSPLVERIAAVLPPVHASVHSLTWAPDERAWAEDGSWRSFTERSEQLDRIRRVKAARAVLAELEAAHHPATTSRTDMDHGGAL